MAEMLRPLGGHTIFLLLVQVALLLVVARLGAEAAKRLGLPAVVGELTAGIALGPTIFGHYFPAAFASVFPHLQLQFDVLEVVATLGMVLLLLLTGLETDIRLLKNLGRAALIASGGGMVVPFALGLGLGLILPDRYLAHPDHRVLFALFLATAMSISAMPVIAKILMDLDLTKRNIGLVILSAGVVDDTIGWLILSLIAGAAAQGTVKLGSFLQTLALTGGFLVAAAFVLFPMLRWLMRQAAGRFRTPDADLVLIIVVTLLCAAVTEEIGIHAVFGAFIAGVVLHQVPRLKRETVHKLEAFVFAILAPVFFGLVGLKVDLWALSGGTMLVVVLAVACVGKVVGCTTGAMWGGMRFWEAMSIAMAMNARGAMGLVVATIGLSLGILNEEMYSIIVVVAIVTSLMAPVSLRLTMRMVRMTAEESKRILAAQTRGAFDPTRVRCLVPTAAGPNAIEAARLAQGVARRSESPVEVLYIDARAAWWQNLPFLRRKAGVGLEQHLEEMRATDPTRPPSVRRTASRNVAQAIVDEAGRGFDLILIGASLRGLSVSGKVLEEVVDHAPCHVAVVRAGDKPGPYKRLLVPIDGGTMARVAAELALRYVEAVGGELTLAILSERRPQLEAYSDEAGGATIEAETIDPPTELPPDEQLKRISPAFQTSDVVPTLLHLAYDPSRSALLEAIERDQYDMVVLGAENRAIQNRLFFGYENERLVKKTAAAVVIVVPNVARLDQPRRLTTDGVNPG